jgi:AraC-like DNA-binding protein
MPKTLRVITVSPLLKQLIQKACQFSDNHSKNSPENRLSQVIMDEIITAPTRHFSLNLLNHNKIKKIYLYLTNNLSQCKNTDAIANVFAMSAKTLTRLFQREVGMTFNQWCTQLKLMKAIELISIGHTTTYTSGALGYSNDSAFITMFKHHTGQTPSQFLATNIT